MVRRPPTAAHLSMTIFHGVWATSILLMLFPLSIVLFRRFSVPKAAMLVILAGALFAPELAGIRFPMVPSFKKDSVPYLAVLLSLLIFNRGVLWRIKPFSRLPDFFLLLLLFGSYMTAQTNTDPVTVGGSVTRTLPGLITKDGLALGLTMGMRIGLPFLIGRALFQRRHELRIFYRMFIGFALVYVLPILWEGRMSPQLHNQLYGYRAHTDFLQTMRWGGFRPMVFMQHGLAVALFMVIAWFLLITWRRTHERINLFNHIIREKWLVPLVGAVVVYCKSTAVIAYGLFIGPLFYLSPRALLRVAVLFGVLSIAYPMMRSYEVIPTHKITAFISDTLGPQRAGSISFRFENEDLMLVRARQRLSWGWGTYGRNLVYSEWLNPSIPDGYWIIMLGQSGLAGFFGAFGLLVMPIFVAWRRLRRIPDKADRRLIAGLALALGVGVFDLVPNGLFSNYTYLLAGVLYGASTYLSSPKGRREYQAELAAAQAPQAYPAPPPYPGYPPPAPYPPPGYPQG